MLRIATHLCTACALLPLLLIAACNKQSLPSKPSAQQATPAPLPEKLEAPPIKKGSMFSNKPYVTLHIEFESLPHEVYVNGAPVSADTSGSPTDETWPINHLLKRWGDNEIALRLTPYEGADGKPEYSEDAKAKLTVLVQQADALDKPGRELATLSFSGKDAFTAQATAGSSPAGKFDTEKQLAESANGDLEVGPARAERRNKVGGLKVSRTLNMIMPLPEWEFLRSDTVPTFDEGPTAEGEALYESLLSAYDEIWKGLQSGKLDSIMPLFEERSRNVDRAFYLAPGTTIKALRETFETAIHDSSLRLAPVRQKGYWTMEVGTTGRLMRLVGGDNSRAILRCEDREFPGQATVWPITFRKQGSRFIVAL